MTPHKYQSPVGHMTHPDDVASGCLFSEIIDGRRVNCYGSVGRDRQGRPHLLDPSMDISDRWYAR